LLKAADTGQNFWVILASAVAIFIIVQIIIDMIITPKIMGKAMGLNPAILLLSLSIWGAMLGFIGLIIALPLTTIFIAYYKRYVTKDEDDIVIDTPEETEEIKAEERKEALEVIEHVVYHPDEEKTPE
jgi:predicted PurR-regulated permease PerM